MDYMKAYEEWSTNPFFNEATRNELLAIKDDERKLRSVFMRTLSLVQPDLEVSLAQELIE